MDTMPTTRAGCLARMAEVKDAIAAIKAQIAAADLDRQAGRSMDARWFHRAKSALRHRQHELDLLAAKLTEHSERRKDALIEVAREHLGDATWRGIVEEADRRLGEAA